MYYQFKGYLFDQHFYSRLTIIDMCYYIVIILYIYVFSLMVKLGCTV